MANNYASSFAQTLTFSNGQLLLLNFLLQASCAKSPNLFLHPKERMQDTILGL